MIDKPVKAQIPNHCCSMRAAANSASPSFILAIPTNNFIWCVPDP